MLWVLFKSLGSFPNHGLKSASTYRVLVDTGTIFYMCTNQPIFSTICGISFSYIYIFRYRYREKGRRGGGGGGAGGVGGGVGEGGR